MWEIVKDRVAALVNNKIDDTAEDYMKELEKAVDWLTSQPSGWSVLLFVFVVVVLLIHSYLFINKEIQSKNQTHYPEPVEEKIDNKYENFNTLSNNELRDAALDLASRMYAFGANYHGNSRNNIHRSLPMSATEDQRHASWENERISADNHRTQFSTEFMTRYRPDAVAIRHEMARRLGIFPPYKNLDVVLDHGILAGASPVGNAADLISELARRLP